MEGHWEIKGRLLGDNWGLWGISTNNMEITGRPHLEQTGRQLEDHICKTNVRQLGDKWEAHGGNWKSISGRQAAGNCGRHLEDNSETTCGKHVGGLETAGKQLGDTWETTFGRPHPGNKSQKTRQQAEKLRDNNRETVSGKHLAKTEKLGDNWVTRGKQ